MDGSQIHPSGPTDVPPPAAKLGLEGVVGLGVPPVSHPSPPHTSPALQVHRLGAIVRSLLSPFLPLMPTSFITNIRHLFLGLSALPPCPFPSRVFLEHLFTTATATVSRVPSRAQWCLLPLRGVRPRLSPEGLGGRPGLTSSRHGQMPVAPFPSCLHPEPRLS